jgi:single-strand DNA-binding protein
MSCFNQVILIGNLGKDPEILKSTEQGNFVRLSLATTKNYTDKNGEKKSTTQWHVVYLSNKLGTTASNYLKKGDKIFVCGELRTHEWFSDQGERHFRTAIYTRDLKFINVKHHDDMTLHNESPQKADNYSNAMQHIRDVLSDHLVKS